jgi:hypothetical protein
MTLSKGRKFCAVMGPQTMGFTAFNLKSTGAFIWMRQAVKNMPVLPG